MRPICFGGSFNPIHHGHLICARAAAERAGFDRVILIPSAQPPHKPRDPQLAAPEHRLAMCRLAAELQRDFFEVSDIELTRTSPSYTIDTVRQLKASGMNKVAWLIGADMLMQLPTWYRPLELIEEATFYVVERPGCAIDWSALPPPFAKLRDHLVSAPLIEISATEIRRRVRDGLSIEYLTPPPVARYIEEHGLYR
jgi:nicotinate-nucleotide adenylyltransferase